MSVHVLIEAFEEEELIGACVWSALDAGADHVHVWDGAFYNFADHPRSYDDTLAVAREHGATAHEHGWWRNRGDKIDAMFQQSGLGPGDHALILDADERLVGVIPKRRGFDHALVYLVNAGPNDMPGVRKVWPDGDYSTVPYPALRILKWTPMLRCELAGIYFDGLTRIKGFDRKRAPILPVIEGLLIEHHTHLRNASVVEAKRRYYLDHELPEREAIKERIRHKDQGGTG